METLNKLLQGVAGGFIAQLTLYLVAIGLAEMDIGAVWLWNVLLPGVPLFALDGPHSTSALSGLRVVMAFNTMVYAIVVFALHSWLKRMQKGRVFK